MKNALLLLLIAFVMAFAPAANAAYVIKKTAPEKEPAKTEANQATYITPITEDANRTALDEFKNLPREERMERVREAREVFKEYKKGGFSEGTTSTVLLVILAILLPPLAVGLHEGKLNSKFWISLLLWLLFYIPGLIYALIVILGD